MTDWKEVHLAIVAKMLRAKVVGSHHKQKDTIVGWCGSYEGDTTKEAIEDLVNDLDAPLQEKGRGTIQLTTIHDAKKFITEYDEEEQFIWYL